MQTLLLKLAPGLLIMGATGLSGCPSPPPTDTRAADAPGAELGVGGTPAAPGGTPAATQGQQPPPAIDPGGPPTFASLIQDGEPSLTITVTIEGASSGQVDFQTFAEIEGRTVPRALHVEPFSSADPLQITAPGSYDEPIYVVAYEFKPGDGPGPTSDVGTLRDPIRLDGSDQQITITMGEVGSWYEPSWTDAGPLPPSPVEPFTSEDQQDGKQAKVEVPPGAGDAPPGEPPPPGDEPPPGAEPPPSEDP